MKRFIYYVLSLLIMVGCKGSRDVEVLLDRVDMLMAEQLDSAYTILVEIDGATLLDESKQQARYALLLTRAQYKSYLDPESDSLINIAAEYYEIHGSEEEKFYAYLYQGLICCLLGERRQSTRSLYRALYNSESVDDHYHKGQLFVYLSSLYAEVNNMEYLRFARLAAQEYVEADLIPYYLNAKTKEAIAKLHLLDYDGARLLLDTIHSLAFSVNDTNSICDVLSMEANLAVIMGDVESADQIYKQLHECYDYELNSQDLGTLSYMLVKQSEGEKAQEYLASAREQLQSENDSLLYYTHMVLFNEEIHADKQVLCYQDSLIALLNYQYWTEQKRAEYAEKSDYLELKQHREQIKNQMVKGCLISGLVVLVLIILLLTLALQRNRAMAKMQQKVIETMKLEKDLHAQEYESALMALKANAFIQQIHDIARSNRGLSADELSRLNALFCELLPRFEQSLRELISMSDMEWQICMLLKISCSPGDIAVLLNRSAGAISSARIRMYSKVFHKKGRTTDWDEFINSL